MLVPVTVSLGMAQVYQGQLPAACPVLARHSRRSCLANRYTRPGTGCSAVWLARRVWVAEVAGSNPASPTRASPTKPARPEPARRPAPPWAPLIAVRHTRPFDPERAG